MTVNSKYKHSAITDKVIGCALQVHKILGNGFQEAIYQTALAIELELGKVHFKREVEMPIYYRERQIGTRRADFLIQDQVLVELKAISKLDDSHYAQMINYLEAFRLEIGLLINFGETSLRFKRFIKTPKSSGSKPSVKSV